jgi:hypothetical protein
MKKFSIIAFTIFMMSCGNEESNKKFEGNWIEVMPVSLDVVEGVTLGAEGKANSIGMATLQYEKWKSEDDKLILWGKSIGNGQTIDFSDTLTVISITADSLILEKHGMYRIKYYKVASLDDLKPFNVVDSLRSVAHTTELETRVYVGSLPTESCYEMRNTLTIYNYKNSGDGVYKLTSSLLRPDGEMPSSNSYGRVYTLRGSAANKNAIVYQLVSFNNTGAYNFLYEGDKLHLLNSDLALLPQPVIFCTQSHTTKKVHP